MQVCLTGGDACQRLVVTAGEYQQKRHQEWGSLLMLDFLSGALLGY
jgi:hypothetical protein